MNINWKYIGGTVTILGVLGLTTYAIVAYRREKKAMEEEITVDEAREIYMQTEDVKKGNTVANDWTPAPEDIVRKWPLDVDTIIIPDKALAMKSSELKKIHEEEDRLQMEEELKADDPNPEPEGILLEDEGEGKLRYDPNSDEALNQFMMMEIAEWSAMDDSRNDILRLYDFDFNPSIDGDEVLRSKIVDYRSEFFGNTSRWVSGITWADVVLHFARATSYNLGYGISFWAEQFINYMGINHTMSDDEISGILDALEHHMYINEELDTFGIFGLDRISYENALLVAKDNIDDSLTFEIEFNEFLKNEIENS